MVKPLEVPLVNLESLIETITDRVTKVMKPVMIDELFEQAKQQLKDDLTQVIDYYLKDSAKRHREKIHRTEQFAKKQRHRLSSHQASFKRNSFRMQLTTTIPRKLTGFLNNSKRNQQLQLVQKR